MRAGIEVWGKKKINFNGHDLAALVEVSQAWVVWALQLGTKSMVSRDHTCRRRVS